MSQGMLDMARKKDVYQDLRKMMLGERLDFPDNTFAAVVACGVFALGHAPPESLNELVRITRPGGYVIFTIRTKVFLHKGFKEKQETLEKQGKWRLIEMTRPYQSLPLAKPSEKPGPTHHAYVYQVS
ncbi:MAG: class I SAM-dependent methyltransferase [Deltaproteobacteria bacterium]|nr:class I SAM-dependent methyltransferase [Deltaproteobacteria bacterium]